MFKVFISLAFFVNHEFFEADENIKVFTACSGYFSICNKTFGLKIPYESKN